MNTEEKRTEKLEKRANEDIVLFLLLQEVVTGIRYRKSLQHANYFTLLRY